MRGEQGDIKYEIKWNTLAEYLRYLEQRGVSCNVASFIGATTIREHVIGLEDKQPTPEQLEQMRQLVRQEMEAGALGIGTSLIYPPAFYAKTEELIELCKVAAKYQGKYISHMRSEGNQLLEAIDELLRISKETGIPAEIYHIKAAGQSNWGKADAMLAKIEAARKTGLKITANMYTYTAAGTGLDACLPPWTEDGGYPALFKRLRDPATREKIAAEVRTPSDKWENLYLAAGSAEKILLSGFKSEKLKPLTGKSLAEVAKMRGKDPIETAMDLISEDEIADRYDLLPHVGREREERDREALGLVWIRRSVAGAGRRLPEVELSSARLRQLRARARKVCPRRKGADARGRDPEAERSARDESRARPSRIYSRRNVRGRGGFRSRDNCGSRHLREAAPVCGWNEARVRERRPGFEGWRAHRSEAGPRVVGPGEGALGGSSAPPLDVCFTRLRRH
jgi:N-acyl-D-aspartate/D-glutamate deacylase